MFRVEPGSSRLSMLTWGRSALHGTGVFLLRGARRGDVLERCPVPAPATRTPLGHRRRELCWLLVERTPCVRVTDAFLISKHGPTRAPRSMQFVRKQKMR